MHTQRVQLGAAPVEKAPTPLPPTGSSRPRAWSPPAGLGGHPRRSCWHPQKRCPNSSLPASLLSPTHTRTPASRTRPSCGPAGGAAPPWQPPAPPSPALGPLRSSFPGAVPLRRPVSPARFPGAGARLLQPPTRAHRRAQGPDSRSSSWTARAPSGAERSSARGGRGPSRGTRGAETGKGRTEAARRRQRARDLPAQRRSPSPRAPKPGGRRVTPPSGGATPGPTEAARSPTRGWAGTRAPGGKEARG